MGVFLMLRMRVWQFVHSNSSEEKTVLLAEFVQFAVQSRMDRHFSANYRLKTQVRVCRIAAIFRLAVANNGSRLRQ
jgi:hypothetical protein